MYPTSRSRLPVFTPTQLTTYRQCPEKYHAKYIERRRVQEPFNPALARGNAAHTVLAECFEEYRRRKAFPIDLRARIDAQLPRLPYPDDRARDTDLDMVLQQVQFALCEFDGRARVLAIEGTYDFPYRGDPDCPPFILRAKVDRVLYHDDAGLEHSDYKTGARAEVDAIQNVASRIIVRHNFVDEYAYIRSSTVFLALHATRSEELTRAQVQETWREVKQLVNAILTGADWRPIRSPLCTWCPFFGNGCSLDPAEGEGDETADWLGGAG